MSLNARSMFYVLLMLLIGVIIGLVFTALRSAQAHMHDRADLDGWMNGLTNKQGGQCCSNTEARRVEDPDYEGLSKGGYRVKIDGEWLTVPESRVIQGPNKYGQALAWPYKNMSGAMEIRCFLPGAGI